MNDINILPPNSDDLTGYFANWSDNSVEIPPPNNSGIKRSVTPYMVDDTFSTGYASQSDYDTNTNAMII